MRVVKYLVDFVTQFPSDTECTRYIATISDKVLCSYFLFLSQRPVQSCINSELCGFLKKFLCFE